MQDSPPENRQRRGRRAQPPAAAGTVLAPVGGRLALLSEGEIDRIHDAALAILADTGLADSTDEATALVLGAGGSLSAEGRLLFPSALVARVIDSLPAEITLCGRRPGTDLVLGGTSVYLGSGGASPQILDLDTGRYRDSVLADIHDAARIVEQMDHIHFFSRPMVARDIEDPAEMELNTAWACLSGTAKHVMVSASSAESVDAIAALAHGIAGSEAAFRERPFLSLNVNHVVPPLRFDPGSVDVLIHAARRGIPVMVNTFGQLGASSPVTIAGCVAQTTAETLAGMVLAWLAAPDVRAIFGPRPMVTDLRTGAMAGGGGEQAKLTAAAIQMARRYALPSSTIAGASDSKWPDAQAGHEKCLSVTLALQAGAHFVTQAAGTQASLMATALESYVIDNDMLGSILSAHTAIEVTEETVDPAAIHAVTTGAGHFLGEAETLARMNSDFLYPQIGDRRTIGEWQDDGAADSRTRAHARVREILAAPPPAIIDAALAARLETEFDLRRLSGEMTAAQESQDV
ncbi:MAG: trimethylamine methyltransferase family protein [Pseudomonadota bacterium]|nr:trimethylamine methyltransferase family protein [Pseudomonadota bacterium]